MSNRPIILGINGSPVKKSRVSQMLARVLKEIKKRGGVTEQMDLANYKILPNTGFLNDKIYLSEAKDDLAKLQKNVLKADGIIFASPTHWFSPSAHMKLFLDGLTSLEHYNFLLEGKVAGFITYGPQGGALNNAMLMTMIANHMGMLVPPYAAIFDEGRKDNWLDKEYGVMAKNILAAIAASKKINWGYEDADYKISPIENL